MRKSFGDITPLKDIDIEINKGDVISLIGPSGTGKSTLLRCLIGLEKISAGKIYVYDNDMSIQNKATESVRMKMGMVFQSFNLFEHKTVIENVMMAPLKILKMPKQEVYNEAMELLGSVGLSSQALEYPSQLSGGQKQRVAIVRTMMMHPEIILFDEPTSALDPKMAKEVGSVIKSLSRFGYTILIVTHDMHFAKSVSTRVFYMDEGIIYEDGTVDDIFNHPKKAKTASFVRQMKSFCCTIKNRHFDSPGILAELADFCNGSGLNKHLQYAANFVFEELLFNTIVPHMDNDDFCVEVSVTVSDADKKIDIVFDYDGKEFNVIEKCDDYARTLINHWKSEWKFSYDGKNHLFLKLE